MRRLGAANGIASDKLAAVYAHVINVHGLIAPKYAQYGTQYIRRVLEGYAVRPLC